jgi:hypothetical protein
MFLYEAVIVFLPPEQRTPKKDSAFTALRVPLSFHTIAKHAPRKHTKQHESIVRVFWCDLVDRVFCSLRQLPAVTPTS